MKIIHYALVMLLAGVGPNAAIAQDSAAAASAQEAAEFNLFDLGSIPARRVFVFDAAFTEQFDIAVPAPFRVALPRDDRINLISDGAPENGFVKFTYTYDTEDGPALIENITIHAAEWELPEGSVDPMEALLEGIAPLMYEQVFNQATAPHGGGEMLGWRQAQVNGLQIIDVIGRYEDAIWGPMLLRITAIPNPGGGASYFMLNNIRYGAVPIDDLSLLGQTLGGQMIASFNYEPQE
ncbi:MAG: hypothetical protein JKX69_14350 [Rhodobacteraceae bacterium]|nr:hypothetical protein [Paracoccaceae bacterium]